MKKILVMLGIAAVLSFTSCNDDGYSLDSFWVSMATIDNPSGTSNSYMLVLDNGEKLWPAAPFGYYNPKNGQRVIANYTLLSNGNGTYDHDVKINSIFEVLTKPAIKLTTANADSIGNDKLMVKDIWVGSHFLNIEFRYPGSGYKTHMVNLVYSDLFESKGDTLKLQFRQNGYGDNERYLYNGIVSFNLANLTPPSSSSQIILSVDIKNLDGNVETYNLKYNVNGTTPENRSFLTEKDYNKVE